MPHKYSDDCTCQNCTDTWNKALFAAVDKSETKAKKKRAKKKGKGSK